MKRVGVVHAFFCGILALSSTSAWASEEGHEAGGAALPQLDAALYPGLLFWAAVSFALFFVTMKFLAVPAMQDIQDRRRTVIDTDLSVARDASDEAAKVTEANRQALDEARQRAQKTVNDIIQAADAEASEQREKQQQDIARRLQVAEANMSEARVAAMKETPHLMNDLVNEIVAKVLQPDASARAGR